MKSHDFSRRALNLCLAVYRITAKFAPGEVLAGQLRELGNQIAGDLAEGNFAAVEKKIDRLKIYFAVAKAQNWVKPINWSIMDFEYYKLQQEIIFWYREPAQMGEIANQRESEEKNIVSHNINNIKRLKKAALRTALSDSENSNPRQSMILAALNKNYPLKMSDLIPLFKDDVSERTLRNELQAMIKDGLVKRNGEKRHTEYRKA